ncbi:ACN9-domain-containing protein [Fistulina hepatica ATCC 64428]|uniref:Succinate dehydrogenase assembly factor 3 n=1 Tax=Fistulina hepatica ATCC 64428 TaxID=1128425 RepID=A0A0D7AR33_9AGAR|nr:ACN9-domain-containing protein [Fistulina hepatica ATCC 64428]
MFGTLARCAESLSATPHNVSVALLPPVPLYRHILRAHRRLPDEMRSLGDAYVKSEFRRHQEVTNPGYILGFLAQWKRYLDDLPGNEDRMFKGKKLDPTVFEKMSKEQLAQLYELMHATKNVWKPDAESDSAAGDKP